MVPNPYTLLSTIPETAQFFTVLDLKNAIFTIPLHPTSQLLFTFIWTENVTMQDPFRTLLLLHAIHPRPTMLPFSAGSR
jgi:hypothetical protein